MESIFKMIGGLGFFMYGMHLMSGGLRKVASHQLRGVLGALTKTPVIGLLVGALVTAVVQSSSFTTVMTVGLVNAAMLTLKQGICVILGANIGTTVTAWIVGAVGGLEHFKITDYALPLVGVGVFLAFVPKRQNVKNWGSVLLGFGMLFVGIHFMKGAFPVDKMDPNSWAHEFFRTFSRQPLLGILAGTLLTMLLQSSSVSIMIVQVLAFSGIISFEAALPIILGDNIGTTITAQLAALQSSTNGKRVAWAHTLFNVVGACLLLPFLYIGEPLAWWTQLVNWVTPSANIGIKIAMAHFLFNTIIAVVVFLPLVSWLERASIFLVRGRQNELELGPTILERHLLATPVVALDQVRSEIVRMLAIGRSALADAATGFFESQPRRLQDAQTKEDAVDGMQADITQYLIEISEEGLSPEEAGQLPVFMHSVNDAERFSDHAVNIIELAVRKDQQRTSISEDAQTELREMLERLEQMAAEVSQALAQKDRQAAKRALEIEDYLNHRQIELQKSHVSRLNQGGCSLQAGLLFLDFVDNMEEMGDKLANIAEAVISGLRWER